MSLLHDMAAKKILATGTPLAGTLVGMHIWISGGGEDSPPILNLAWAVEAGGTVYGVYQRLNPLSHVRIGMPVDLRVDGMKAVIDWGAERGEDWKPWKKVPARGIRDERKGNDPGDARDKWLPATVTIEGTRDRKALFGLINATDAAAVVRRADESWPLDIRKRTPPFYATHLWGEGIPLLAWVSPADRNLVIIDWIAAALATPGIGEPPAQLTRSTESIAFVDKLMQPKPPPPVVEAGERKLGKKGEVTFETFVEICQGIVRDSIPEPEIPVFAESFGVPEGTWPEVQAHWLGKMKWNPKLGFKYGQAITAVMPPGAVPGAPPA